MSSLPVRRSQFTVGGFAHWLTKNGAELTKTTNPYEVIRYRAYSVKSRRPLTHIVYSKENGLLNFQGLSREHYLAFLAGEEMPIIKVLASDRMMKPDVAAQTPKSAKDGPSLTSKQRAKLLARDGDECWFCGRALGDDITIEHLVPKSKGGGNTLDNYALAHAVCNHKAANKPLVEKIELRARMRATHSIPSNDIAGENL